MSIGQFSSKSNAAHLKRLPIICSACLIGEVPLSAHLTVAGTLLAVCCESTPDGQNSETAAPAATVYPPTNSTLIHTLQDCSNPTPFGILLHTQSCKSQGIPWGRIDTNQSKVTGTDQRTLAPPFCSTHLMLIKPLCVTNRGPWDEFHAKCSLCSHWDLSCGIWTEGLWHVAREAQRRVSWQVSQGPFSLRRSDSAQIRSFDSKV